MLKEMLICPVELCHAGETQVGRSKRKHPDHPGCDDAIEDVAVAVVKLNVRSVP